MHTKPLAKVIGNNIANRRRELGLTQMALAELAEHLLPLEQQKRDAVIRALREIVKAVK